MVAHKPSARLIQYLQVLNAELVSVHVDGREEDGLHLVVSELVRGQVGGYQHLGGVENNLGINYFQVVID